MQARDFVYWLQGFFELSEKASGEGEMTLNAAQVRAIKQHLAMVFKHEIDPSHGDAAHQAALAKLHDAAKVASTGVLVSRPGVASGMRADDVKITC